MSVSLEQIAEALKIIEIEVIKIDISAESKKRILQSLSETCSIVCESLTDVSIHQSPEK